MNRKIVIWNLKIVEKNLHKEGKADDAYTIRLALDSLSSNWRTAEKIEDIATNYIEIPIKGKDDE